MSIFGKYIAKSTRNDLSYWARSATFYIGIFIFLNTSTGKFVADWIMPTFLVSLILWIILKSYELWEINFVTKNFIGKIYNELLPNQKEAYWKITDIHQNRAKMECVGNEFPSKESPKIGATESWHINRLRWRKPYL